MRACSPFTSVPLRADVSEAWTGPFPPERAARLCTPAGLLTCQRQSAGGAVWAGEAAAWAPCPLSCRRQRMEPFASAVECRCWVTNPRMAWLQASDLFQGVPRQLPAGQVHASGCRPPYGAASATPSGKCFTANVHARWTKGYMKITRVWGRHLPAALHDIKGARSGQQNAAAVLGNISTLRCRCGPAALHSALCLVR